MAQPDNSILDGLSEEGKKEADKVRRWRHNIQRELLPLDEYLRRRGPLTVDIARPIDIWFQEIESYDGMTVRYLSYSKIGKVMRHVVLLDADHLPSNVDDVFKFRERARKLIDYWQSDLKEGSRHVSKPSDSEQLTSTPAPTAPTTTEVPCTDVGTIVQDDTFAVGAPPTESPLAKRTMTGISDERVDGQGSVNSKPVKLVLDIAPPDRQHIVAERPKVPEDPPSSSAEESMDEAEAAEVRQTPVNPDTSHETSAPPSVAEVDPGVQGAVDGGIETDRGSVDDWVVIDVNVQMENIRIE